VQHGAVLPATARRGQRELDQVGGPLGLAGRERVGDRLGQGAGSGVPPGGGSMHLRHPVRALGHQTRLQRVGEQVVVAVASTLVVERDEEQVALLELLERSRAVAPPGHGVAQRTVLLAQQ